MRKAASLRSNIAANLLGQGWIAVLNFAVVPFNLHFLGAESFGLLGLYSSLAAIFALLDLGLGAAMSRELARIAGIAHFAQDMSNLTRTMELVYLAVGSVIAVGSYFLAPFVAGHWLNLNHLDAADASSAFALIGLLIASRWPMALYQGAMSGLQQQVRMNQWRTTVETARLLGGVVILAWVSPTIQALLIWNVLCAAAGSLAGAWLTWRLLPSAPSPPAVSRAALLGIWRYAAGMSVLAVTSVLLMQTDKIILSKALPLEWFGYYSLATTLTAGLWLLMGPIQSAVYPKLCELVARQDMHSLAAVFHKSCRLAAIAVLPIAATIAAFPHEAILVWTHNAEAAAYAAPILRILMIGASLLSLMTIPHNLQLAGGWLAAPIRVNLLSVCFVLPAALLAAGRYGAIGVACVVLTMYFGQFAVQTWLVFAPLGGALRRPWLLRDALAPLAASYSVAILLGALAPAPHSASRAGMFVWLAFAYILSLLATFLSVRGFELLPARGHASM